MNTELFNEIYNRLDAEVELLMAEQNRIKTSPSTSYTDSAYQMGRVNGALKLLTTYSKLVLELQERETKEKEERTMFSTNSITGITYYRGHNV